MAAPPITNNIEYWNDEYAKEITELEVLINEMQLEAEERPDGSSPALMKLSTKVDEKIALIKKAKKFYGLELRLIKDRTERSKYDEISKEYDVRVNTLIQTARSTQENVQKKELFGNFGNQKNPFDTEGKNNDEVC